MKQLINKNILITGATGSFGNKFIDMILKSKINIKKIIIYSRDEFKQYNMKIKFNSAKLKFIIGDVRDLERLRLAMKDIDIVVHAAALKHVQIAEVNPIEYIKTNIMGADNIIKAAIANNVKKVIALSTDKAAKPINLYGATKLASDKLFVAANYEYKQSIKFSVVRYGNVLNSRGSVIPYFLKLKKENANFIPITDELMTRFWVSLEDAVKFVFNCLNTMEGGEIFVPKIKSVKTLDLAKIICKNKKIRIIGIRPGEKVHEVMCPVENSLTTYEFKDKFIIFPDYNKKFKSKLSGRKVDKEFEYSSDNKKFLMSKNELQKKLNTEKII